MESTCRRVRWKFIENRYRNYPDFQRVRTSLDQLASEVEEDLETEREVMSCYGEHLDHLHNFLDTLTADQIRERYAQLKSELFSTSMAFFSSVSEHLTQYLRRVKARLRGLPADMKRCLMNYMRDWWIEKAYPMLQKFIDKIDKVARLLGVDSYSISLSYALIGVEFTFKPTFKK